jgi:hypothetical protein
MRRYGGGARANFESSGTCVCRGDGYCCWGVSGDSGASHRCLRAVDGGAGGDAVGAKMSAGTTPTPEFKKTCTWTAKGVIVTLMLQDEKMYQAGKNALVASAVKPTSGVGEDAYYVVVGENVGFEVKKGSTAFKVTVYNSSMPREKRQAIERTLAQQVLSKL